MKVLYVSESNDLQILEIEDLLDYMLKNGAPSALLRDLAKSLDIQGFFAGSWAFGSFTVTNLNLPKANILILSDEELKALYSYAVIGQEGISEDLLTEPAKSAWLKIGELTGLLHKEEEKIAYEGLPELSYPG